MAYTRPPGGQWPSIERCVYTLYATAVEVEIGLGNGDGHKRSGQGVETKL